MKAHPLPAGYKQPPYVRPSWATPYRSVRYSWVDATGQVHHCEGALARVDRWGCATVQHKDGGVTHQTYPHCDDLQPVMEMK